MRHRALPAAIALAALSTGLLAGCGANEATPATGGSARAGGTLYVLSDRATNLFDPGKSSSLPITSLGLVHRRLTAWDAAPGKTTTVVPDLATDTGKVSDGGKTWTYTLRDGLKFSDGSPITSADIRWGVERSFTPAFSGGLAYHKALLDSAATYRGPFEGKDLASIETPDDKTIVFHLARAYGDWPWVVSTPAFAPVPKGKGSEATYGEHPVASGPFQVTKYQSGVEIRLERNPNWSRANDPIRTGLPDAVVFQLGQQSSVISKRLIDDSGNDRFAFGLPFVAPAQLAQVQGNAAAKQRVVTSKSGALAYLAINTTRGKLTDPKVRQAFQYAVDKGAYQVASAGSAALAGDIATTLITDGIAGREQFDLYPAPPAGDPAKAKALLAEAGLPNGLDNLVLVASNANDYAAKAQAIQAGLSRAGIKVTIKALDSDAFEEATTGNNPDYDLVLTSWQPDFPSPNANLQPLFATSEIGNGAYNTSRYSSPEVDRLIEEAQSTVDPAAAAKLWAQLDRRIMQDSPVVPLIFTRNSFLHGSGVTGFQIPDFPAYPNYLQVGLNR
ncbi:ABC transporter substrate-binding protein [Dactylosporangium matsuzakiense]|uniref:ABC transporter substrate-binding protein n=1 Tax=Dactylosporangium matsuzakiense TaxID=53360 RepID=A0A9W6KNI5_9ACTN|nr:ABC transporter substrate-binding protein [Dactylosporangium matsuzakiense]UWZ42847.1 ABC transporter substrate-binding protein [Dactylosporangium matsuzakiense]GLL04718.1 ABC transporter substrate-binding protein [Dactylosporangium matsuzakiense]